MAAIIHRRLLRAHGLDIPPTAVIGGGLRLSHPQGIVIGHGVEIGQYVTIGQYTTIGGNFGRRDEQGRMYPRIGDRCWISVGCVIAGPVYVGDHVVVGANAVVVEDVPPYAVVGGVPARILRMQDPGFTWLAGALKVGFRHKEMPKAPGRGGSGQGFDRAGRQGSSG